MRVSRKSRCLCHYRQSSRSFAFVTGSETDDHRHHLHAMCLTFEYILLLKPLNRDK